MWAHALIPGTVIDDVFLPVFPSHSSHMDSISKGSHLADNCPYAGPARVAFYLDPSSPVPGVGTAFEWLFGGTAVPWALLVGAGRGRGWDGFFFRIRFALLRLLSPQDHLMHTMVQPALERNGIPWQACAASVFHHKHSLRVGWRNHGILKNYWSNLLVLFFCSVFYVTSFPFVDSPWCWSISRTHIHLCRNIHLWTILYNNFRNIFCIWLIIQKYNSESYLRRNIISNPIFHFSVELKFAKHANVHTQSVFLLLFLSVIA